MTSAGSGAAAQCATVMFVLVGRVTLTIHTVATVSMRQSKCFSSKTLIPQNEVVCVGGGQKGLCGEQRSRSQRESRDDCG